MINGAGLREGTVEVRVESAVACVRAWAIYVQLLGNTFLQNGAQIGQPMLRVRWWIALKRPMDFEDIRTCESQTLPGQVLETAFQVTSQMRVPMAAMLAWRALIDNFSSSQQLGKRSKVVMQAIIYATHPNMPLALRQA